MLGTYVPEQSATGIPANCTPGWIMYGSGAVYLKYYTDDMQFSGEQKTRIIPVLYSFFLLFLILILFGGGTKPPDSSQTPMTTLMGD